VVVVGERKDVLLVNKPGVTGVRVGGAAKIRQDAAALKHMLLEFWGSNPKQKLHTVIPPSYNAPAPLPVLLKKAENCWRRQPSCF
jgi:hypothetical protein